MNAVQTIGLCLLAAGFLLSGGCTTLPSTTDFSATPLERQILVTVTQTQEPYAGAPRARLLGGWRSYGPAPQTARTLAAIAQDYSLLTGDGWVINALDVYCAVLAVPPGRSVDKVIAKLLQDTRVAGAQRMHRFETRASPGSGRQRPNDPYYAMQTALQAMNFNAAHAIARGTNVQVAVIDTGIDGTHPDLTGQIGMQRNFVDSDQGQSEHGRSEQLAEQHGTAIAGLIAAVADNNIGITGAAPGVEIWALRACWQTDAAGAAACNSFTLAKALGFALDQQADIINLSLTGPADTLLAQLTAAATRRGVIVIGAAPSSRQSGFPASASGVIAVQAAGAAWPKTNTSTLVAPANDILTLAPHNQYAFLSGDSLATALVTGVAALLLEAEPAMTADHLTQILHRATIAKDGSFILNACQAVNTVHATPCSESASVVSVSSQ